MADTQTITKIDNENILIITTKEEKNIIGKQSLLDQIAAKEQELAKLRDLLTKFD